MATHSSTLTWKIPSTEEPGRLQSVGSRRIRHDSATSLSFFTFMHWRRKWHPTPVFLPGEFQGRGRLVGCHLWGRTESDTTEATQPMVWSNSCEITGISTVLFKETLQKIETYPVNGQVKKKKKISFLVKSVIAFILFPFKIGPHIEYLKLHWEKFSHILISFKVARWVNSTHWHFIHQKDFQYVEYSTIPFTCVFL